MEILKPIFLVGPGRSGTTILSELFTRHKDTGYFEHYIANYFDSQWKSRFIPLLHKYRKIRYGVERPIPANGGIFHSEIKYTDETQITEKTREYYYRAIKTALKLFKASRFVNKKNNHCLRLRWLNELFPNAYYVIIWRDPKSVVSSTKRKMPKQPKWLTLKEKFGKNDSDLQVCINIYNFYKKHLIQDLPIIKNRSIEIHYEDLVKDTRFELKKLYEFTELKWYNELEKDIPEHLELNYNEKWKTLPPDEIEILNKSFQV